MHATHTAPLSAQAVDRADAAEEKLKAAEGAVAAAQGAAASAGGLAAKELHELREKVRVYLTLTLTPHGLFPSMAGALTSSPIWQVRLGVLEATRAAEGAAAREAELEKLLVARAAEAASTLATSQARAEAGSALIYIHIY